MKALIPAGGKGKRLRPITNEKPKPLVKIGNKTLIEHLTEDLFQTGITEITIVVGYKGKMITERYKDAENVNFLKQEQLLGTANAIGLSSFDEPFLVINGDVFIHQKNIEKILQAHLIDTGATIIGSKRVDDPCEYGVFEVEDKTINNIIEKPDKPPTNLINTGVYVLQPNIYDYIRKTKLSSRKEYEITDSIQMMIDNGEKVKHQPLTKYWVDVGRKEDLRIARNLNKGSV